MSTWNGTVDSDFTITLKPGDHDISVTRSKRYVFDIGGGGARISAETFSGDITISSNGRGPSGARPSPPTTLPPGYVHASSTGSRRPRRPRRGRPGSRPERSPTFAGPAARRGQRGLRLQHQRQRHRHRVHDRQGRGVGDQARQRPHIDRIKADVQQTSRGIAVCVLYGDNSYCDDNGYHSNNRNDWNRDDNDWGNARMDLEVAVPVNLQVSASSVSGDVSVTGAQGDVRANTVSGDVRLDRLHASSIKANTVSGDLEVHVDVLTGRGDLSFNTVSGDLTLFVPRNFDADLSMSSVSGDVNSDFALTVGSSSRMRRGSIDARIGAGGRRLDVHTVSGNLRLRSIN